MEEGLDDHGRRRIVTVVLLAVLVGPVYVGALAFFGFLFVFLTYAFVRYGIAHYPFLMGLGMVALWGFSGAVVACVAALTRYVFSPGWWRRMFS